MKKLMIVGVNNTQVQERIDLTNKLKDVINLSISKLQKYEDIGRLDKGLIVIKYLTSIFNIVKYWYYSNLPYSDLPKCIETTLECSLDEIKDKLKILPRELYLDLTSLLIDLYKQEEGIGNLEIIGVDKNNKLIDFQTV